MKAQSSDKLILFHLNINSIRNKFEALKFITDSFPSAQFLIKGFSVLYRFEENSKGIGLPLYIHEDIPSIKILTCSSNCDTETLLVEINLKPKWLLNGPYNPSRSQISHHLESLKSLFR